MNRLILTLFLILGTTTIVAQGYTAIGLESEWTDKGLEWTAVNNDFSPYYLDINLEKINGFQYLGSSYTTMMDIGTRTLFTLRPEGSARTYSTGISYRFYRGDIRKKPNTDFQYAMPIRQGDVTRVRTLASNHYTMQFDMTQTIDTVYACRGGIICNDNVYDTSAKGYNKDNMLITIYHNDGTMAEYTMFDESLVYPGDIVKMGDPIAVCQSIAGKREINIAIYFLDKNKIELKTDGRKHSHFTPFFNVGGESAIKLEEGISYVSEITEDMIMQDMSKRERSNYLKIRRR